MPRRSRRRLAAQGRRRLHVFCSKNSLSRSETRLTSRLPKRLRVVADKFVRRLPVQNSEVLLPRQHACVSLGNVATHPLSKTVTGRRPIRLVLPDHRTDLPASGARSVGECRPRSRFVKVRSNGTLHLNFDEAVACPGDLAPCQTEPMSPVAALSTNVAIGDMQSDFLGAFARRPRKH
jgi:hypothetical protein